MSLTKLSSRFFLPVYSSLSKVVVAESRAVSRYNPVVSYHPKYHIHALGAGAVSWLLGVVHVGIFMRYAPACMQSIHHSTYTCFHVHFANFGQVLARE
jgi:hypothetical protein